MIAKLWRKPYARKSNRQASRRAKGPGNIVMGGKYFGCRKVS